MKTEQSIYSQANGWLKKTDNNLGSSAQLVFVFGNRELLKEQKQIDYLKGLYPSANIVGCSTSGEICQEEVFNHNIIVTAVWFEKTKIEIAEEHINVMEDSFVVGEKLAAKLDKEHLVHTMIISEGLNINGSELTKGLNKRFKEKISPQTWWFGVRLKSIWYGAFQRQPVLPVRRNSDQKEVF